MNNIDKWLDAKSNFSNNLYYHHEVWDKNEHLMEADKFIKYGTLAMIVTVLIGIAASVLFIGIIWALFVSFARAFDPNLETVYAGILGIMFGWIFGVSTIVGKYKTLVKRVSP